MLDDVHVAARVEVAEVLYEQPQLLRAHGLVCCAVAHDDVYPRGGAKAATRFLGRSQRFIAEPSQSQQRESGRR